MDFSSLVNWMAASERSSSSLLSEEELDVVSVEESDCVMMRKFYVCWM